LVLLPLRHTPVESIRVLLFLPMPPARSSFFRILSSSIQPLLAFFFSPNRPLLERHSLTACTHPFFYYALSPGTVAVTNGQISFPPTFPFSMSWVSVRVEYPETSPQVNGASSSLFLLIGLADFAGLHRVPTPEVRPRSLW